jgi:DNA-binding transcriptional MerR regulator
MVKGESIPEKLYYRIGEVSRILSLKPSVLRFWETEFPTLTPHKSRTGQRLYSRDDLESVRQIKQLLYHEKMTIEGARQRLKRRSPVTEQAIAPEMLQEIRRQLLDIRLMLS